MRLEVLFATRSRESSFQDLGEEPLQLLGGDGPWEVEIGFGKGRYLLESAAASPEKRFLGIEVVSKYYRLCRRRAVNRGLDNLMVARGEALYMLSAMLPQAFASRLHVYFPDPWPKARHHKRRLFDPETVDLVLGLLRPGGELCFATDFLEYGESVVDILQDFPGLEVQRHEGPWPDGARTNYEAKYMREGRPVLRLRARLQPTPEPLHPDGKNGIVIGPRAPQPDA